MSDASKQPFLEELHFLSKALRLGCIASILSPKADTAEGTDGGREEVIFSSDVSFVSTTTCVDISNTWMTTFEILVPLSAYVHYSRSFPFESGSRLDMGDDERGELGLDFRLRERRVIRWNENGVEAVLTGWYDVRFGGRVR